MTIGSVIADTRRPESIAVGKLYLPVYLLGSSGYCFSKLETPIGAEILPYLARVGYCQCVVDIVSAHLVARVIPHAALAVIGVGIIKYDGSWLQNTPLPL